MRLLACLFMALMASCGFETEHTVEHRSEITITFPECADFPPNRRRIECIRAATEWRIEIGGDLTEEELQVLKNLGIQEKINERD